MTKQISKIEKLIAELCPNGAEFKEIGNICKIETGKLNANAAVDSGEYMFFTTAKEISKIDKYRWNTEALLIAGNANVGDVKHYIGKFEAYQRTYVLTKFSKDIDVRFLYFVLKNNLQQFLESHSNSAAMTYIVLSTLQEFKIPLPPLAVQEEIVKILNNFTELEAELEARKKQYEHYRSELLTFGDGVRWTTLGEIIHFMNGKGHEKHINENGKYIVVNSKFVSTEGKVKKYSKQQISPIFEDDILMVMSDLPNGKALAKCFYVDENDKYTLNQRICALTVKDKENLNAKYLFYILNRNSQLLRYDSGADQTNLRKDDILQITIPLPSLAEQARIVSILDKFDALVNDISIGLPAELAARRSQYEYYRGKLLSFKEYAN